MTSSTVGSTPSCSIQLAAAQICIEQNAAQCECFTNGQQVDFLGPFATAVQIALVRASVLPRTGKFCGKAQKTVCSHLAATAGCCCTKETDAFQQCIVPGELASKFHQQCQPSSCLLTPGGEYYKGGYFANDVHYITGVVFGFVLLVGLVIFCCCWFCCCWGRSRSEAEKVSYVEERNQFQARAQPMTKPFIYLSMLIWISWRMVGAATNGEAAPIPRRVDVRIGAIGLQNLRTTNLT